MGKIKSLISENITSIENISKGEKKPRGLESGFDKFDRITKGFQTSELTIIGSRVSMGKTSLAISLATKMTVEKNIPLGFISLQVAQDILVKKIISQETNIPYLNLSTGYLERHEWETLNVETKKFDNAPLYIKSYDKISIENLQKECEELVKKYSVECIIIDYLQLIEPNPTKNNLGNKEQEIALITRKLKQIALKLDISVIALSQLSRAIENRGGDKRPLLTDLRDSGTIEENADMVVFLFKPEYYKIDEWDDEDRLPTTNQGELIIAKHNNGRLDKIRVSIDPVSGKFSDLEEFAFVQAFSYAQNNHNDIQDVPF